MEGRSERSSQKGPPRVCFHFNFSLKDEGGSELDKGSGGTTWDSWQVKHHVKEDLKVHGA